MQELLGFTLPEEVMNVIKKIARERYSTKAAVAREYLIKGLKSEQILNNPQDNKY